MVTFIIQARTGSTRLPNKIVKPFCNGKSILGIIINKLKQIPYTRIIIATSENPNCDIIESFAKDANIDCYRGSENNVLKRFIMAAEKFNTEKIIRICSDNPFLELQSLMNLVSFAQKYGKDYDYSSFNIDGTPSIKTHYGFWAEYVTINALKKISKLTNESAYLEHVTNYIYTHPQQFNIYWHDTPSALCTHRNIRLTIDTEADFLTAQSIYSETEGKGQFYTIDEMIKYLDNHPSYYEQMNSQIRQNTK